ncbi:MAG: restriction endonuclease [Elusimicrobiota bacterium]
MSKTMWMVRAGEGGYLFDEFKNKNVVAIGWNEVGDLTKITTLDEIKDAITDKYPDFKLGKIYMSAGQVSRFKNDLKKNDYVITYNPDKRIYLIGEIIGDYEFNKKLMEYNNIRKIKWIGEVSRDRFSVSTKNALGAISTLFEINNDAVQEIINLLEGKENDDVKNEAIETEEDTIKEEMVDKAHEFIKDKVLKLNWEEMQELVAGILRGMGYKTIVSPKGPDRGHDIQASPDGLGLEDPRILVEVKHREAQMGAEDIRSFTGGLRQGNKGLYVSTGGFAKDAKYEADRSSIPITLVDLDMLAKLIIQYYDKFDADTKALIPLIKIYWPA